MALAPPNNALAWAHFRLRGGWTRSLTFTGSACALGAILIITSARLNPGDSTRILWGWSTGILSAQAICLGLIASGRVMGAIRTDLTSKMIESHRLMPHPPMHAIAGYIIGGAGQAMVFALGLFLLGGLTAGAAGVDLSRWVFASGVLFAFCVFIWVVCTFAAFGPKLGGALMFLPIVVPYMAEGGVLSVFPALTVLLSPVIGTSIFDLRNSGATLPVSYAISFAAQAYFGAICYVAAARKYRRADAIGIDTVLALLLVLGWVGISFAGLREWEDFRPRGWGGSRVAPLTQMLGSLIVGIVVALPAIAANTAERLRWRRHEALHDPAPLRRPIPAAVVVFAATIMLLLIPLAPPTHLATLRPDVMARSGACIIIALLGVYFLTELLQSTGRRVGIVVFLWMLITWAGPFFIDLVRYSLGDMGENEYFAGFSTCSPIGTLLILWNGSVVGTTFGMLIQLGIIAIPGVLWATNRLKDARAAVD